ncbi:MAG TPA: alpha/beta hydrolase domain-containing protein, partial [Xanthobacteraceae bacterium]|nr:alpha/beta hydrolase domain-containing protein [Xanthobacteraceae bacterium]
KFSPVKIYELWYEATQPKVLGMGYAATRDVVSFLRYERADSKGTLNPALGGNLSDDGNALRYALGVGISQSGRYLRHYIELGMNKDEQGRRVFDGMLAHISGAGKVFANHTFGMPNRTATQHEDRYYPENWFPFSAAHLADPLTGQSGALLRNDGFDPLLIETNTSTEYWQKGASLLHIDPATLSDIAEPQNARTYLIAGTQHGGHFGSTADPGACANPRNPNSAGPALRALLVALDEWVTKGVAPPKSRIPSIADHSAIEAGAIKMPVVSGFSITPGDNPAFLPVDWIDPPKSPGKIYQTRVPAVDIDGNEIAGIRLPPVAAPLGTHTGWNVYKVAPTELCDRDGSFVPFAKTKAEREAAHDPRLSIEERYGNREAYVAKVKAAADALVSDRLLLASDAQAFVKAAEIRDLLAK